VADFRRTALAIVLAAVMPASAFLGISAYADSVAEKKVKKALAEAAPFLDITYDDVRVDLFSLTTHIEGITVSPVGAPGVTRIEEVIIYEACDEGDGPSRLHLAMKGINAGLDGHNSSEAAEGLRELGYEEIRADAELNCMYDREEREFVLKELSYRAEDMGAVSMNCRLGNLNLNPGNPFVLFLTLPSVVIYSAELRYDDDSLVSRLLKAAARERGGNVEDVISEITEKLDSEMAVEESAFAREAMKAVKDFFRSPDNITVTVSPGEPVPLGRLRQMEPREIAEALNMRVGS
jgi:hypothetical protein